MVQLEGIVTEDGQLVMEAHLTLAPGRVRITIEPIETPATDPSASLTREEIERKLAVAGHLRAPKRIANTKAEYDFTPIVLPPGSPGSEVLVDEDRGER